MSGFFAELQRRKVYRVAAAYIIAAGFIIQIGSAVFPAWELPNWTLRLVVVILLAGFPVALILAWAYDVTPQGIQATPTPPGTHRCRNVIARIAIGLAISAVAGFFLFPRASGRIVEKSIAVLPFQSLSDEKENAYFADGIQDDILTNLSKIGDLKVISRMSVMSYRGDAVRNAREIGKALGVATLLEQAIKLDPKFAAAFAGLSMVESWIYHSFEPTAARREKARLNADESLRLQPNLPEGHLALGLSYYYGDRDYERALAEFELAKRDLPNEAQAYLAIGAIQRRQGKWTESTANLEKAAALDPKNASMLINLADNYMALRNF